jgi:CheY-like chemotaxis protein
MNSTNHTILLVEDDPNDVFLIQRALRKSELAAHHLEVVDDGDKATAYLSGRDAYAQRDRYPLPALILLDLKIPCKSGLEVLAWLREQSQFKYVPVVVLTSSKHVIDMKRAYNLGANSYLVKPVDFDRLHQMIQVLAVYWLELNKRPDIMELS